MTTYTNRLAKESSPYLQQHAHNPVDWYPWGQEALEKAREEDKPILVSIGYAACHWCHVMERESFEDVETANLMNSHFINIKIDREERPDLDHIYMDAVQAMAGSGGWPLNVFLTPDLKPFYGGTYFPPVRAFNRASWKETLMGVSQAFRERRPEIDQQAEVMTQHLLESNHFGISADEDIPHPEKIFSRASVGQVFNRVDTLADKRDGGFGKAPKFPQSFIIRFLLHHYYYTGEKQALDQALLSLDKMALGGIYDQLGGGFARYSVDDEWLAPHFEKMLYDNALLLIVYSEAYQLTGRALYKSVISETLGFVERELYSAEGGFYSALDADSEGVEGKFYVWSYNEVNELLKEDASVFSEYFDITEHGNWEHTNILRVKQNPAEYAASRNMDAEKLDQIIRKGKDALLRAREMRIRPSLDDKILLGWNALMVTACCKAYQALGDPHYRELAIKNVDFLLNRFHVEGRAGFLHTYKNGEAKYPAFLDDYAFLIQALIELQEITSDNKYLVKAKEVTEFVIDQFSETETGFFYFTSFGQQDVVIRKKELFDGAVPSGNSQMAVNLYYLGIVFDISAWVERSAKLCGSIHEVIIKYPTSFGVWAIFLQALTYGVPEIALLGNNITEKHEEILRTFIPSRVFQASTSENTDFPLLSGKPISNEGLIYLCKHYTCQNPVNEVTALLDLMKAI